MPVYSNYKEPDHFIRHYMAMGDNLAYFCLKSTLWRLALYTPPDPNGVIGSPVFIGDSGDPSNQPPHKKGSAIIQFTMLDHVIDVIVEGTIK